MKAMNEAYQKAVRRLIKNGHVQCPLKDINLNGETLFHWLDKEDRKSYEKLEAGCSGLTGQSNPAWWVWNKIGYLPGISDMQDPLNFVILVMMVYRPGMKLSMSHERNLGDKVDCENSDRINVVSVVELPSHTMSFLRLTIVIWLACKYVPSHRISSSSSTFASTDYDDSISPYLHDSLIPTYGKFIINDLGANPLPEVKSQVQIHLVGKAIIRGADRSFVEDALSRQDKIVLQGALNIYLGSGSNSIEEV